MHAPLAFRPAVAVAPGPMLNAVRAKVLRGEGIGARVVRGSALTFLGFGGSQGLRLASNLILTRLLFPEAFGLMAIIALFLTGLQMISDVGLVTCIVRSKRGNDPAFLNTTWTIQIIRGMLLCVACILMAGPVARFYEEPILQETDVWAGLCRACHGAFSRHALPRPTAISRWGG